ncbi:hypothetical protein FCV24_13975 [Clostridium botulinum]|uniref:hypothetical protein n=1 Tax=Clostridium botulinum TaxID=1491 RepID=UPI0005F94DFF|nr:hypothetical protein [Clostridium botulinum]MBY6799489.1 hypothetical protein [Clostridium botulinum]NFF20848.1 hypothetical protein [Clostridium botulinum]NFM75543.1 hypothetical protein [Clostridium botulinum]NFP81094.1 hypothetical protein [Clostridium botulinum]NFP94067.1 hypothetical protein [Clostridium botulinum]
MNRKNIKSVLSKKFNEFCESIKDESVKTAVKNHSIITGGCITSMLLNEEIHDFDIYFTNKETCLKVAKYYVNQFNETHKDTNARVEEKEERIKVFIQSAGVAGDDESEPDLVEYEDYDEMQTNITPDSDLENIPQKPKYRPVYLSSNAITLSDKIQLIIRFYGEPDVIHENYDFVHCTNYWTSVNNKLVLRQEALEAILNKELKYVGSKYPLCSIIRTRKFINRGWKINAGQYLKMCMQLNEFNLKDIKVLEDQLVGVDSGYFAMLINALQKKKESDPNFTIENDYVVSIIDKIF